jgi:COMPASS component SWD3
LELLDRQESQKAFGFLTKRLKPLEQISRRLDPKEFDDLCYLVTCTSVQSVPRYKFWQPQNAREELMETLLCNIDLDRRFDVEIEDEDVPSGRLRVLLERHTRSHQSLLSDRDDTKSIASLPTRMFCTYHVASNTLSRNMKCVSASSNFVVAATSNHNVVFWPKNDAENKEEKEEDEEIRRHVRGTEMKGHTSRIWCLDSKTTQDSETDMIVSGSSDGTVRFWCANPRSRDVTCSRVLRFDDSEDALSDIYAVRLESNAKMCAAGGLSGLAHLINVETGKRVVRLEGHTAAVTGLCFTRQTSNIVVTSSNDTCVRKQ